MIKTWNQDCMETHRCPATLEVEASGRKVPHTPPCAGMWGIPPERKVTRGGTLGTIYCQNWFRLVDQVTVILMAGSPAGVGPIVGKVR